MRYLVTGWLREPCGLTPVEYVTLAIREWETVVGWVATGRALAYGRLTGRGGGLLLAAGSDAEARGVAAGLPFAPYADIVVHRVGQGVPRRSATRLSRRRSRAARTASPMRRGRVGPWVTKAVK